MKLLCRLSEKVSKQSEIFYSSVYLDTNRPKNQVHSPIVVVEFYLKDDPNVKIQQHAVVLKDPKLSG